ncbi:MAG: TrmB family transcriptional regulator [Candidatus Bathyarchaeia archaeon]
MKNIRHNRGQKALETLGLTEYEAKAYISLVEKGTSTAGDLSALSEIPHSKIYEVLMRLEKRRLVETQKGRPILFKAVKPSAAIEAIDTQLKNNLEKDLAEKKASLENSYKKRFNEISEAQKTALEELKTIYETKETAEPTEDIVWTIQGKTNLNTQANDIILSALKDVRIRLPQDDFTEFESTIKTACLKGAKIQLLVHRLTQSVRKLEKNAEIFIEESLLPTSYGIIIADGKNGMFISEKYEHGFKTSGKSVLMVLTHFYEHELEESIKIRNK